MDKKISYETIKEIMNERCPQVEILEWYGTEITVQKIVSFKKMSEIVLRVAAVCFNRDDGSYMPEVMNTALRLCIFEAYTNIELPDDIDEQNFLIFGSGLWDLVTALIDADQLGTIELAINRRVKARLDTNRAEFERAVNNVMTSLTELGKQLNGLFGNITEEKFNALIDAISTGGVDEQKLVQAVLGVQLPDES